MTTPHNNDSSKNPAQPRRSPGGAPRRGRGRSIPDATGELRRLSPRDRWLIDLLGEHQTFTTNQITALAFDSPHTARNRLAQLVNRDVLARFRHGMPPGSGQMCWTLGPIGAAYLAARDDEPVPRLAVVVERVLRLAASPRLAHLVGVNGLFVDLAAHARRTPGASLDTWWSERRCLQISGGLVRPDGHGVWTEHGRTVSWWLEYDRGTEPGHRVLAKLEGYHALQQLTGLDHTVLIRMQTPRQETELQRRLQVDAVVTGGRLLVATASGDHTLDPAGPVWLPVGHTTRVRLAHLPTAPTEPG